MGLFWAILFALSAVVTVVVWGRNELKGKPKKLIYPIAIILLTTVSTIQFQQLNKINEIERKASELVSTWPKIDRIEFQTKGERIGIIMGGLAFLEKYQEEFPQTYKSAKNLVSVRLNNFEPPKDYDESFDEYRLLEDVTGAMIKLVESISK